MLMVWDEPKRLANLAKHGLDFAAFEADFDLDGCVVQETYVSRTGRERFKLIGAFGGEDRYGGHHLTSRIGSPCDHQFPPREPHGDSSV